MVFKIKDLPLEERPRERLVRYGPKALSDAELLAVILSSGNSKENVLDLSRRLLKNYNLKNLARTRVNNLKKSFGIGQAKACQLLAAFELGKRLAAFRGEIQPRIKNAKDAAKILLPKMSDLKKEHFIGLYLDSRKKLIAQEIIFIGSLDSNIIHPREIFEIALAEGAAAIILAHNHPSGDPKPSQDDIDVTKQLVLAGQIIGIEVLDHLIIGDRSYFSLREKGYFDI